MKLFFIFFVSAFTFAPSAYAQSLSQFEEADLKTKVQFSIEHHIYPYDNKVMQNGLAHSVYSWDGKQNKVTKHLFFQKGYLPLESGMPASEYLAEWKLAAELKKIFRQADAVRRLQRKIKRIENYDHLGATYLAEAAEVLKQILEIPDSTVLVSIRRDQSISVRALKLSLIGDIQRMVYTAEIDKNSEVYRAFWETMAQGDSPLGIKTPYMGRNPFKRASINEVIVWWRAITPTGNMAYSSFEIPKKIIFCRQVL